jgi:hypothetical protein
MASKIVRVTTVRTISPEEYVVFCLSPGKRPDLKGCDLKVVGNVDLREGQDGIKVHTLRKAMIEGGVFADDTCALSTIEDCVVEGRCIVDKSRLSHVKQKFHAKGDFSAKECKRLQFLGGQYDGELNLEDSIISRLEKGLVCKGELCLTRCRVQRLNCQVEGRVSISDSGVREFGPDFRVGGELWIDNCKRFHELGYVGSPTKVTVFGEGLKRISKEFSCTGKLRIRLNHSLENISPEIKIGGLDLLDVDLKELDLPNINGDVTIDKCVFLRRIKTGGTGEIEISRCPVENIDQIGNEAKSIMVENCHLVGEVGGAWKGDVAFDTMKGLRNIQPSFECGGNLRAFDCHVLQKIGGRIGGDALVASCKSIESLGSDLSVGGNLHIGDCNFSSLTLGCQVGGDLKTLSAGVSHTSDTMHVAGDVGLRGEKQLRYMRGFVGGDLNVDDSSIVSLEDDLEVRGNISAKGCDFLAKIEVVVGGTLRATGKHVNRAKGRSVPKLVEKKTGRRLGRELLPKAEETMRGGVGGK